MRTIDELADIDVMALTVWAEARGESPQGQTAVAWVIRNRAEDPGRDWWGDTIRDVCLKKWQFSCWNENDSNRVQMLRLSPDDPALRNIRAICERVIASQVPDPTEGCTHYCRPETRPGWKYGRQPRVTIGHHDFYCIGPGA